jgi:hypothetical protein
MGIGSSPMQAARPRWYISPGRRGSQPDDVDHSKVMLKPILPYT